MFFARRLKLEDHSGFLTFRQGEEWRKIRTMLNGKLLKPSHAQKYLAKLSTISEDLTDKIQVIRDHDDTDKTVPNILNLLYAWSIECKCTTRQYLSFCQGSVNL